MQFFTKSKLDKPSICHITSMHGWDDDRIYQRACIGLLTEGIEVHLIATYQKLEPENTGVRFHWIKLRKGWRRRFFSSAEAYKHALSIDANVFHFHDPDLLPWMLLLAFKGKKVVYDVHENYAERILALKIPKTLKQLLVKLWSTFERFCISKYAGIVTTTQSMLCLFEDINIPKVIISNTPYLYALGDTNFDVQKKPFSIYTSGTNSDKRNCIQTIEALPYILKKIPQAHLIFVGKYFPDEYELILKDKAIMLGVEEQVEIQGMLPWKENFNRTAQMEIGCVFYEDNVNNRVTIPNRLFEYMYAGVAIIGESFFEVKKVIEDAECGVTVNSSDPKSIADGVIRLFENIPELRKMQRNARSRIISTYAFEHELKKMIAFYCSIIN